MNRYFSLASLVLTAALACGKSSSVAPPLKSVALPTGVALKPYTVGQSNQPFPSGTTQLNGKVWVALSNLNNFAPGGPGLLVSDVPSTGVQTTVDLGGTSEQQCQNAQTVRSDSGLLYVTCSGPFGGSVGQGLAEVDPTAGTVKRFVATPAGFVAGSLAISSGKVWIGDLGGGNIVAVDKTSFTAGTPIALGCASGVYTPAMLAVGSSDLYVLCAANDGYLLRLDGSTGQPKNPMVLVGAQPIALALTGDNRIAVINSTSGTLTLVTPGTAAMTVAKDVLAFTKSGDLEDVKAMDHFLFVMSADTQNLIKVDLSTTTPTIVDAVNVNPQGTANANPNRVEVLDDKTALVSDAGLGVLLGVTFTK